MNKQQLASKIWAAANEMRSKIEASEYKDYILGFIFYKFLSEQEETYLKKEGATEEDIKTLTEEDSETVKSIQSNLGYFIEYKNLFSTWLGMGSDFNVGNVRDALSAFNRLINPTHTKVFNKIFLTLETGLSKLGENANAQTKAVRELIHLIDIIPMDNKQGYDVLGFIYEYLISNFAANAGKKAGEFYTPHEVSVLMSEIIAHHLQDCEEIKIYDPTSGSGSLLINIGQSVAKHINDKNKIKYYAQELKENTYNLTRMNLVMRGILPDNIVTRCGDTLEDDWPYFDDNDKDNTYEPLTNLDAVVSNPPYSQKWDPTGKEHDPRFMSYGVAPKTKADYAFLLHDLYHLRAGGIMTIVLPHGVLFRGGDEGEIRKNLIENNNIDAIIGLPANIFFGTGIPTIIMVLKKGRTNDDVLIIDASKGFAKEGKNNKLRARDIKKIADTYNDRLEIPHFSRKVSRKEIRENDYNLNIPRYVDSSEKAESIDIYASMFGGIPKAEIKTLGNELEVFPSLTGELFTESDTPYVATKTENAKAVIDANAQVVDFKKNYAQAFANFGEFLNTLLIDNMDDLVVARGETMIADEIFARLANIPLVDKYEAYQILDDKWQVIATDLEMIQTEGKTAITQVDANMVIKKKDGKETEVQDGWAGHILPFELVQKLRLKKELDVIASKESEVASIQSQYEEILESIAEEDRGEFINEDGTAFVPKEIDKIVKPYSNGKRKPDVGSIEETLLKVKTLMNKEKSLNTEIKNLRIDLHNHTKDLIESLSIDEALPILYEKWIAPIASAISVLPDSIVSALESKIDTLTKKYSVRMIDIEAEIEESEATLNSMIDDLEGDEFDMLGLKELQKLLGGGKNE
jgi:type I restriction enzyme M protein